jgi:diadenylate cyclase
VDPEIEPLVSGGFVIDIAATSQRVAELAKMDGALVLDADAKRVLRANVHLVPDPSIPTSETGTRHRSAERTARQTGQPVIAVSESMGMVNLYFGETKHVLEEVSALLVRANQALSTLERYRSRLDEVTALLSAREVEDAVTVRDAVLTLQRAEMLRRIAGEVEDARDRARQRGAADPAAARRAGGLGRQRARAPGARLPEGSPPQAQAGPRGAGGARDRRAAERGAGRGLLAYGDDELELQVTPRGYRMLSRVPRLPATVIERLVERFHTLPRIMEATIAELDQVEGVGGHRARMIQDNLRRLSEPTLRERFA